MAFNRLRFPLIAVSLFVLLAALWAGLVRLGWAWPALQPALPLAHGPLMVSGFLGTLIGVERAVALRSPWTYLGPVATALGSLLLIFRIGGVAGPLLLSLGGVGLVLVFASLLRQHRALYVAVMAVGSAAWLIGNLLWFSGWPVFQVALWWAGFLILTIAGERLELGRLVRLPRRAELAFVGAAVLLLLGMLVSVFSYDLGTRLGGLGMLALAAWLLRYDIARRTVRKPGLTRFIATCLLAGYAWLAAAGSMGLWFGGTAAGPRYDAFLHAIFLGFVFSMIFGHAPIIFPAVLGRQIRFTRASYLYLALLHFSLLLRVTGDLAGAVTLRLWGGLLNGLALLLFLGATAVTLLVSSRLSRGISETGSSQVNRSQLGRAALDHRVESDPRSRVRR